MEHPEHPENVHEILANFPKVKRIKANEWQIPCPLPGHSTPDGHATVTDAGDRALFYCFNTHQDKFYKEFCNHLGFSSLKYSTNRHKSKNIMKRIWRDYARKWKPCRGFGEKNIFWR